MAKGERTVVFPDSRRLCIHIYNLVLSWLSQGLGQTLKKADPVEKLGGVGLALISFAHLYNMVPVAAPDAPCERAPECTKRESPQ
jgi:hypothetical protein